MYRDSYSRLLCLLDEELIGIESNHKKSDDEENDVSASREHVPQLCDYECDAVCETAFPADSSPCPLAAVHLSADGTHSCEARSAEKVECEERETCDRCECCTDSCICITSSTIEDTECTDDVLLCDESRD